MNNIIYMDNHATTPIAPEVLAAMIPYLTTDFGNASSMHPFGVRQRTQMKIKSFIFISISIIAVFAAGMISCERAKQVVQPTTQMEGLSGEISIGVVLPQTGDLGPGEFGPGALVIVPPAKAWGLVKSANKPTGLPVSFSFHRGW